MTRLPRWPAALLLTALSAPALAGSQWLCGLSDELTRLVCVADVDPRDEATAAAAAPAAASATVNGTRFPLDTRQRYTVDLWSPPSEAASVELLARATICYRSPGCQVTLVLPAYLQATRR